MFDDDDPHTTIHVRLLAWCSNFKSTKHFKKISKELMHIAGRPKRWWHFCMTEYEKKEIEPNFTE